MPDWAVVGVDIGTSSSKGVLVASDGTVLHSAVRAHSVRRPAPGLVEMGATVWWDDFVSITRELTTAGAHQIAAVGVSGMGPCVLLTDHSDVPLRPAILYGVDTRSVAQLARLEAQLGADAVRRRGGSPLTSQAAGAKIAWVADNEPEVFARARRLYMPSSWLVRKLTGAYLLDHHSASQCTPMYDIIGCDWYAPWVELIAPQLELPPLRWPTELAGTVASDAAAATGLPAGIPVATGTIDAWAEALSVDAHNVGDLMLMYGTTMFLIHTVPQLVTSPVLWGTVGALKGTRNLAGGMAASGGITDWLRDLFGDVTFPELLALAEKSGVGARGLLMLPYFAGERSPVMDPDARGTIAGLTLSHTRGDMYRAALEATAFGVRHNITAIHAAGGDIRRVVAVGGGAQSQLWTQVVCDVIGLQQERRRYSIGACYGGALLAAGLVARPEIAAWNPVESVVDPDTAVAADYDEIYSLYLQLYSDSAPVSHALARRQHRQAGASITADTSRAGPISAGSRR